MTARSSSIAPPRAGAPPNIRWRVCPGHKQNLVEEFAKEGVYDIRDIPDGRLRNAKQEWVRKVTISGKAELKPGAKKVVDACAWPRYYLDFETVMFAVPIWKDTRPYESLPFPMVMPC